MRWIPYQSQRCCKVASLRDHHGHFIRRIKLNPVSGMPCAVCWWNCPYPGTSMKDHLKQKSPRTAVGDHEHPIQMDDVKVIAREDNMWQRKIRESIEIRTRHPTINRSSSSMTNCCHVTAVPVVTWPRRINLIRLMKWPWWSRKLATLQHIWLW